MQNTILQLEIELLNKYEIEPVSGMAYTEKGESDTSLLFIHGLGSNRYAWLGNFKYFSDKYHCIAIDLPNYGDSPKASHSFSIDFFKECVTDFCIEKALKKVVLIGHSMGAQIAVHLAVDKPGLYQKLILLAPAGIETFNDFEKQWFKQIYKPELMFSATEDQIKSNFESNFVYFGEEAQWMLNERLSFMRHKEEYFNYCKMICKCVLQMLEAPSLPLLSKLLQPTLALFGAKDLLIPNKLIHPSNSIDQLIADMNKLIPLCKTLKIETAGHFVQTDQKLLVNKAIQDYLLEEFD